MGIQVIDLERILRAKAALARSIECVINRPVFLRLWDCSDDAAKQQLKTFVEDLNKEAVLKWLRNHPSINLEDYTMRRLYEIAKKHAIKNYARLSRSQLVKAIKEAESRV